MAKFRVSESPSTSFTIGNSRCNGGTWYSSGDVGVSEEVLAREYPFLEWDNPPKKFAKETSKVSAVKSNPKISEDEFFELTRKEQENLLDKLNIKHTKKDKEADLWNKYESA